MFDNFYKFWQTQTLCVWQIMKISSMLYLNQQLDRELEMIGTVEPTN